MNAHRMHQMTNHEPVELTHPLTPDPRRMYARHCSASRERLWLDLPMRDPDAPHARTARRGRTRDMFRQVRIEVIQWAVFPSFFGV